MRKTIRILSGIAVLSSATFLAVDFVFSLFGPAFRGGASYLTVQIFAQTVWIALVGRKRIVIVA